MVDKKGQQMTLGTIIAIVLGIAVLVFLIFGFSSGWNNLWDRVTSFSGGANVDTIVQACALKCSSGDKYGFCDQTRTVKFGEEVEIAEGCKNVATPFVGDSKRKSCKATCSGLVGSSKIKVASCPSINCN